MGDYQQSSRRRAIINNHRADGRSSNIIVPTGDCNLSVRAPSNPSVVSTGASSSCRRTLIHILHHLCRRALSQITLRIVIAPMSDHRESSRRRAIIKNHPANGQSSRTIALAGDHHQSSRQRATILNNALTGDCTSSSRAPSNQSIVPMGTQPIESIVAPTGAQTID